MEYTALSPFMRPISCVHLKKVEQQETSFSGKSVNKWELLRELSKAQAAFGVTERDLTVLQGLLSFFPDDALGKTTEMIVFPSNKSICERLNGMPCSTMRRHLARLVEAGLLQRRDSPNGKRYVRRHGDERVSFGFDLTPLYRRAEEVARAAEAVRETENRVRRLREVVSLMRRDLAALADFGKAMHPGLPLWCQMHDTAIFTARALRRKLSLEELSQFHYELEILLDQSRDVIDGPETEEMIVSDAHFEQHQHKSNKESIDSEQNLKNDDNANIPLNDQSTKPDDNIEVPNIRQVQKIPLHLVTTSCPSLAIFYQNPIRHWHQLHDAACHIRPAMGISAAVWDEAQQYMGPEQASIVLAAMLERISDIRSPGGYLRALTSKAATGKFSCGSMIMALIGRRRVV